MKMVGLVIVIVVVVVVVDEEDEDDVDASAASSLPITYSTKKFFSSGNPSLITSSFSSLTSPLQLLCVSLTHSRTTTTRTQRSDGVYGIT